MNILKKGMTLIEILVVVAIIAILALIAVPALSQIIPYAELRSDSRYLATAMRQGRMMAANSHRPVRVVVDCGDSPCTLRTYTATFITDGTGAAAKGEFEGWVLSPNEESLHFFADSVSLSPAPGVSKQSWVKTADTIFWAVFLPSSRMIGSHAPFELTLASNNSATRTLVVDGVTGRATVADITTP